MKKQVYSILNNLPLMIAIYFGSIVCAAFLFYLVEPNTDMHRGLWWAQVTASTIGYGDVYPVTTEGRLIASFFANLWSMLIYPIVVANIIVKLIDNRNEFTHEEQEELKRQNKLLIDKMSDLTKVIHDLNERTKRIEDHVDD
jgi:voltage-gated potassium channel